MAQKTVELNQEAFSCSICLNLLEDPVAIPCGHSYCMGCINRYWEEKETHSCPECRHSFMPRPVLMKNTMLANVVEQLKQLGNQAPDDCYAGAEDVACDVCSDARLKAVKFCLVCLVSYCSKHLQPHYQSATFEKHRLVEPCKTLQESICRHHGEVMKMFCRTDQQLICCICHVNEHKGHDTVSAEVQKNIQQRIQEREEDFQMMKEKVGAFNCSDDKAVDDINLFFTELLQLLDKRCFDWRQQVRRIQDGEVSLATGFQEMLLEEIAQLRRNDELEDLFLTENHNRFLHSYPSLSRLRKPADSLVFQIHHLKHFEEMKAGLLKVQQKLESLLAEDWSHIPDTPTAIAPSPPPQPKSRGDFLKYSCDLSLDPNSAHQKIALSGGNRRATYLSDSQPRLSHTDRFLNFYQVLSKERMTGRFYFEVSRKGRVYVAVSYSSISRGLSINTEFGFNRQSWALLCEETRYVFCHNNVWIPMVGPGSSVIGVYVDHSAGILSFYSISPTMKLLHSSQTEFTEPLHAGIGFYHSFGDMAEFSTFS